MSSRKKSKKADDEDDGPVLMKGQSTQYREGIRKKQRDLFDTIQANKTAIGDVNSSTFAEMRAANNELGNEVVYMRESVLDVQNLRAIAHATTKQAAHLAVVNQSVSAEKLIKELRKHGCQPGDEEAGGGEGDGDFDWQKLGQAVGILFATVPPFETLCGPISKPAKEVKAREKRKAVDGDASDGEEERPEEVTGKDEDVVESTQQRLKVMSSRLFDVQKAATAARGHPKAAGAAQEPVGFFNFAVNPQSFTQTVENIFDLSFLIKQGNASLTLDADGLPVVSQEVAGDNGKDAADQKSTQMVVSLSPADVRRAAALFEGTGVHVPHRQDATYHKDYLGQMVGTKAKAAAAAASASASAAGTPMAKSKGKGRAAR